MSNMSKQSASFNPRTSLDPAMVASFRRAILDEHAANVHFTHTFAAVAPGTQIPWAPVYCAGKSRVVTLRYEEVKGTVFPEYAGLVYANVITQKPRSVYHHKILMNEEIHKHLPYPWLRHQCACKPGPHMEALHSTADMIFEGGGRGSGKSEDIIGQILRNDMNGVPLINDPEYKVLIIRRKLDDVTALMERVLQIARLIDPGVSTNFKDMVIKFSSGSHIKFDHMSTPDSVMDYHGKEYWTIVVDELELLPTRNHLEVLMMACRTRHENRVKTRLFATFNPGGVGAAWIRDYIVEPNVTEDGVAKRVRLTDPAYRGTILRQKVTFPDGTIKYISRQFIFSTVYDNPYLREDYIVKLAATPDEIFRAQMLHGDFFCAEGQVFRSFRTAPLTGEPDNARHVYPAGKLGIQPWHMVAGSMDWGVNHHSYSIKFARVQDVMCVYDEISGKGMNAYEWGMRIANWWKPELSAGHQVVICLSHDAYREKEHSHAKMLQDGANSVLGDGKAAIYEKEFSMATIDDYTRSFQAQCGRAQLVFVNSGAKSRVYGWDMARMLMSWKQPTHELNLPDFNSDFAQRLFIAGRIREYYSYLAMYAAKENRVLPRIRISDNCKKLIAAIPTAVFDSKGTNPEDIVKTRTLHDDVLDGWRYGVTWFEHMTYVITPKHIHMEQFAAKIQQNPSVTPAARFRMIEVEEARYNAMKEAGFTDPDKYAAWLKEVEQAAFGAEGLHGMFHDPMWGMGASSEVYKPGLGDPMLPDPILPTSHRGTLDPKSIELI